MRLRVLSFNIHKGFSWFRRRYVFSELSRAIQDLHPDLVFLQEIHGQHPIWRYRQQIKGHQAPLEELADQFWQHHAYGKNAVYQKGHHGNGILSKYPFATWENIDVSNNRFERRGILHGLIEIPETGEQLHVLNVHFDLTSRGRRKQLTRLANRLKQSLAPKSPMILAGDFNDWGKKADMLLQIEELGLLEVFSSHQGRHAKSFPNFYPFLSLDRIYFRGFKVLKAEVLRNNPWPKFSDHSPLFTHLEFQR